MNKLELLLRAWERTVEVHRTIGDKYSSQFNIGVAAGMESCINNLKMALSFMKSKEKTE